MIGLLNEFKRKKEVMNIHIGAEYIIANALIFLKQRGKDCISFKLIRDLGWNIQKRCNEIGVDSIIFISGHDLQAAICDFSDYFEYIDNGEPSIRIKKNVSIKNLENCFIYYLPTNIASIIRTVTKDFLDKTIDCKNEKGCLART